jgi:hypothetical protein
VPRSLAVVVALSLAAVPVSGQDIAALCRETRTFTNGQWASYRGVDRNDTTTTRFAIVGTEGTRLWWEMSITSSRRRQDGTMIMQALVSDLGTLQPRFHAMVIKSGDRPAQRMPDQMVQMMSSRMGTNMSTEAAKQCEQGQVIGTESITVPAGTFRALHVKTGDTESWFAREVPFGMVRVKASNGGLMELTSFGRDAKSLITETPQVMGGDRRP